MFLPRNEIKMSTSNKKRKRRQGEAFKGSNTGRNIKKTYVFTSDTHDTTLL
jgi:hypothetical protein